MNHLKPIAALIVAAVMAYIYFTADRHQKRTWMIYFWTAVLAIGAGGILYSIFTAGYIPAPCCN